MMDDDDNRKDSAHISSPTKPTKPLPTRNASTRIQEPTFPPSRNTSTMKRSGTTKSKNPISSSKSDAGTKPERPGLQRRRTTTQTRYMDMLLGLDTVPKAHNILASAFVWILLAGYIVFPATFNKFQNNTDIDDRANNAISQAALNRVRNVPLLYIAAFACGIGVFGCLWLWWKWRKNYVWVINRIFLPALLNSIAGLISTLVNVYTAQSGQYSVTAKATIVVTAACSVVTAGLFLLYNSIMLTLVKRKHKKETNAVERDLNDQEGTDRGEKVSRAV